MIYIGDPLDSAITISVLENRTWTRLLNRHEVVVRRIIAVCREPCQFSRFHFFKNWFFKKLNFSKKIKNRKCIFYRGTRNQTESDTDRTPDCIGDCRVCGWSLLSHERVGIRIVSPSFCFGVDLCLSGRNASLAGWIASRLGFGWTSCYSVQGLRFFEKCVFSKNLKMFFNKLHHIPSASF